MPKLLPRLLLLSIILLFVTLFMSGRDVFAACSPYRGQAVINELHNQGQNKEKFVEVKLLNSNIPSAEYNTWSITICEHGGSCLGPLSMSLANDFTLPWIVFEKPLITDPDFIDLKNGTDVIFKDSLGQTIDYVSVAGYTAQQDSACTPIYDWTAPSTNSHTITRAPDGTGDWDYDSGGSGTGPTEGGTNDGGALPVLAIDNVTVGTGDTVVFTLTLSAEATDAISIDYETLNDTALAGTHYTATSGTITIPVGSPAGTTVTVSVNTIAAPFTDDLYFYLFLSNPVNVSLTNHYGLCTIEPGLIVIPDHLFISHDGSAINCMPEDITITAHDVDHNNLTDYLGTITLSTSTGNGDWLVGGGGGVLAVGAPDSGDATYGYVAGDLGTVTLQLRDTHVETVNIDVIDEDDSTESSGAALVSEDENLAFAESGFLFYEAVTINNIGSQICGKGSDTGFGGQTLEIAAIRTNDETGACEAALTGNVTVDIGFECRNPITCTANQLQFNGVDTATITGISNGAGQTYSSVNLDFGSDTDYTAPFTMTYMDAGLIHLYARYSLPLEDGTPSGSYMAGISNEFASRPFGLLLNDDLGYTAVGTGCSSITCQVAARDFTMTSRAYCLANGSDDANSNGIPDIFEDDNPANMATITNNDTLDITNQAYNFGNESTNVADASLSSTLIAPTAGDSGTFTASLVDFSDGAGVVSDANWDEVGIVTVQADINNYFSTSITGRSSQVGRFIPARFGVTSNTPVFSFFCAGNSGVDFNYLGQEFGFATDPIISIEALSVTGSTTLNYGGDFWMLTSTLANRFYTNNQPLTLASLSVTTVGNVTSAGSTDFDGVGTLTISAERFTYAKPVAPEAPFFALVHLDQTAADLNDGDGVCYDPDLNSICDGFQIQDITSSANNAFGRLFIFNGFGPEDQNITDSPFESQYYNGAVWVLNSFDDCTTDITMCSSPTGLVNAILPDPLGSGEGTITVTTDTTSQTVNVCTTNPVWLTDLPLCTAPDDTCGVFTFGIYRGNDRLINWREILR